MGEDVSLPESTDTNIFRNMNSAQCFFQRMFEKKSGTATQERQSNTETMVRPMTIGSISSESMKRFILIIFMSAFTGVLVAQNTDDEKKDIRFNFNKEGTKYLKMTMTNQVWLRFNESNPGTMVDQV